jgi:hypothetical protein
MLPSPLLLRRTKISEALVLKTQQTNLLKIRKVDAPPTPQISIEPIRKQILQNLLGVVSRSKLQRWINGVVPEGQIQDIKHCMAQPIVGEPCGTGMVDGLV